MVTELEKKIVMALQEGLPLVSRPFAALAEKIGMPEKALLKAVEDMKKRGLIRRFGAAVRHQDLGYTANAMVVWKVPAESVEEAGQKFSDFSEVSHCYERKTGGTWQYNLFTMVHGRTPGDCRETAGAMSHATGLDEYLVLFSTVELKKDSMKYFIEDENFSLI